MKTPHRYMDNHFKVEEGDVVLDAGVAEGIFALSVIDIAAHIYLVEADKDWLEPLQLTFADYRDKITLIHAFLSDSTEGRRVRLDDIIGGAGLPENGYRRLGTGSIVRWQTDIDRV